MAVVLNVSDLPRPRQRPFGEDGGMVEREKSEKVGGEEENNWNANGNVIPVVDLQGEKEETKRALLQACEEIGVFKVVKHGVPARVVQEMAAEARRLFDLPLSLKQLAGPTDPFGYGNRYIGPNGDVGWIEYLLLPCNFGLIRSRLQSIFLDDRLRHLRFCRVMEEYIAETRKLACRILELLAEALGLRSDAFSKFITSEESDSAFRMNHYPPCPHSRRIMGFGEHSDPQILTVLHSNDVAGLQFLTSDGRWVTVSADPAAFSINVGDCLEVLSNGRLKSVWHRVVANGTRSRYSMMFFSAPALDAVIEAPSEMLGDGEEHANDENERGMLYRSFSWRDYKQAVYRMKLGQRPRVLDTFRKISCSSSC